MLLFVLLLFFGLKTIKGSSKGVPLGARAKVLGSDDARIRITEFVDFQCPMCANGARYLKSVMKKNPGLIRLQMKYYPLQQIHNHALLSAQYAECASYQGKFWPYHDLLMNRQGNWKRLADAKPAFDQMASDVDLDKDELSTCLQSNKALKEIEKTSVANPPMQVK